MTVYLDLVMLLNGAVDFLLLQGTNRLAGHSGKFWRILAASALGGIYGGISLLPQLRFLGNGLWRAVFLGLMAWTAFGWKRDTLRLGCLFMLLTMALGGLALSLGGQNVSKILLTFLGFLVLCHFGLTRGYSEELIPVRITHQGKSLHLTALRDTGNNLRDPITGERVLVISAEAAEQLTGLTVQELRSPLQTLEKRAVPGLRLLPYRSVGSSGMMLGLRLDHVVIGSRQGSFLAAFAPEGLGREGRFQALTGGLD